MDDLSWDIGGKKIEARIKKVRLFASCHFITRVFMGLCVLVSLYSFAFPSLAPFAICAGPVLFLYQFYRLFSSAFFHTGLLHLLLGLVSFFFLGVRFEKSNGSLCFLGLTVMLLFLSNLIYVVIEWCLYTMNSNVDYLVHCNAVGLSSLVCALFTYLALAPPTLDPTQHERTYTLVGAWQLPLMLHPTSLPIFLQLLLPDLPLMGPVAGVLAGLAASLGWLRVCSVGVARVQSIEQMGFMAGLTSTACWCPCPDDVYDMDDESVTCCSEWGNIGANMLRCLLPHKQDEQGGKSRRVYAKVSREEMDMEDEIELRLGDSDALDEITPDLMPSSLDAIMDRIEADLSDSDNEDDITSGSDLSDATQPVIKGGVLTWPSEDQGGGLDLSKTLSVGPDEVSGNDDEDVDDGVEDDDEGGNRSPEGGEEEGEKELDILPEKVLIPIDMDQDVDDAFVPEDDW